MDATLILLSEPKLEPAKEFWAKLQFFSTVFSEFAFEDIWFIVKFSLLGNEFLATEKQPCNNVWWFSSQFLHLKLLGQGFG